MTELELKFRIPPAVLESLRLALRTQGAQRIHLRAHYFDTADAALARHRVALRLRLEGRHWVQTLKAEGDGAVHRLEHEVRVPGSSRVRPALDPHRHDGSAAAPLLAAALKDAADATLVEQHATDVWRLRADMLDAGGTRIEAALDIGHALADGRAAPIAELELEHKGGPVQGLFDLAAACVLHGQLWQSTVTKAEAGQRLRESDAAPRSMRARPPQLAAGADGAVLMRALLQSALEQVLANASEVAMDSQAVEAVHQLRVGLRRLRVVLRELAALSPAISPTWDAALSATFAKLGEQRDFVAVSAAVQPLLVAAGAPVLAWRAPPAADPGAAVREPGFQIALLAVQALAHAGDDAFTSLSPKATREQVAARLRKLHRQVLQGGRRFEKLQPEQQHRVRKQLKRLRYLADFTAALWPARGPQRCLPALAKAQDALGLHHDVGMAAAAFRREAAANPDAGFAAGYLQAHLAVTGRLAGQVLRRMARVPVFWR